MSTEDQAEESKLSLKDFWVKNSIHFTDSTATTMLTVLELIRVFLDEQKLSWQVAWNNTYKSCCCAFNQVNPSEFELWSVANFTKVLPRHAQLLTLINKFFMLQVKQKQVNEQQMTSLFTQCGKFVKVSHFCLVTCKKIVFPSSAYLAFLTGDGSPGATNILAGFKAFLPGSTF